MKHHPTRPPLFTSLATCLMAATISSGAAAAPPSSTNPQGNVFIFTSESDPNVPADEEFCATAPFETTATFGASLWSLHTWIHNGKLMYNKLLQIGTATSCLEIDPDELVPGGLLPIYLKFELPSVTFTAAGLCQNTTGDVPIDGVLLTGCTLNMVNIPANSNIVGGMASSNSVLNPEGLPGVNTGSVWTIKYYESTEN
ncbi:hypothetical protein [Hahella ganghwensis]|uniref:hypothetical protein n=1 Tax=Hahella ganghwensis TaxID=286420 RepID=UPI00036C8E64|nr:hypothetical protein [Hahella ganghwensis]